jgi:hypothetical protein
VRVPSGGAVEPSEAVALAVERQIIGHPENGQRQALSLRFPELALQTTGLEFLVFFNSIVGYKIEI